MTDTDTADPLPYPEPGQMWEDLDDRAVHQEFTILAVVRGARDWTALDLEPGSKWGSRMERALRSNSGRAPHVLARRGPRITRIRIDRLLGGGYAYMGRGR